MTPKYLDNKWRESTYEKVKAVIDSCTTIEQYQVAAIMAMQFSNGLWNKRRLIQNAGWAYSDAINYRLIHNPECKQIIEYHKCLK